MPHLEYLKEQIGIGYKLVDLEKLIGMSRNTISGIISGKRKLSKQDRLKIDVWSDFKYKPHPLKVDYFISLRDKGEEFKNKDAATVVSEIINTPFDGTSVDLNKFDETGQFETPNILDIQKPKNIQELKSMCPDGLNGFEKSEWVRVQRIKFNI
jgi:hypothetical protein